MTKPQTPRPPLVAPSPTTPAVEPAEQAPPEQRLVARWEDEPPSGGWDAADTVNSFPEPTDLPAPPARAIPAVRAPVPAAGSPATQASPPTAVPATPASPGTTRGPYAGANAPPAPAPAATGGGAALGAAMREEVWAIVRAAVEEAMGPLVAHQRELQARLERAEREGGRGRAAPSAPPPPMMATASGGGSAAAKLAALGGTLALPAVPAKPTAQPAVPSYDQAPGSVTTPDLKVAALAPAAARPAAVSASNPPHPVGPRPSIPPTGYGVSVMVSPRESLDLDAVGHVDITGFDGGARKKKVASAVVVIMLVIIIAVVTMTVMSHN